MLKVRVVATTFATVLAVGLTACGSHQSADTATTPSGGSSGASSSSQGSSAPDSSASDAASGSGTKAATGHLPKGAYDDTSGTTARHPKNQNAVLAQLPGSASASRGCVAVGKRPDVRAGSIAMGNFADARAKFRKAKSAYVAGESFFYVIPASRSAGRVTVTATRLGGGGRVARASSHHAEQAAQWKYFPINLTLTSSGTWRFRVSTPTASACFDARFTT